MAEEEVLKTFKCEFESHRAYSCLTDRTPPHPTAPAALLVLAVRGLESGPRTLQMAIGELVL